MCTKDIKNKSVPLDKREDIKNIENYIPVAQTTSSHVGEEINLDPKSMAINCVYV